MHPALVGPIMATHLKIKESPLLCVTDRSSGHTEAWESSTPTRGATPKRGKTLPGAPGTPPARQRTLCRAKKTSPCYLLSGPQAQRDLVVCRVKRDGHPQGLRGLADVLQPDAVRHALRGQHAPVAPEQLRDDGLGQLRLTRLAPVRHAEMQHRPIQRQWGGGDVEGGQRAAVPFLDAQAHGGGRAVAVLEGVADGVVHDERTQDLRWGDGGGPSGRGYQQGAWQKALAVGNSTTGGIIFWGGSDQDELA